MRLKPVELYDCIKEANPEARGQAVSTVCQ
jgi:hypothetical protein